MSSPTAPSSLKRFLHWLDDNILLLIAGFLLAFIPLYPKIPLWSPIEQYIVRVRLEDFFVLLGAGVWLIQVIRGKVKWRSHFFWLILAYAIISLLSVLSALFVIKTVPLQPLHVGKTLLHYFRYLEYFSLFVIVFSAIKERSHVLKLILIFTLTVIGITAYGFGQKYYYFPVYSTMNREFSKGVRLYLTPHARVQSTFAGHYDMAAYLVVALPLLLALAYGTENKRWKYLFQGSFWVGSWLLILSAARTSFIAFLGGIALVVALAAWQKPTWRARFSFGLSRFLGLVLGLGIIFAVFGADLSERITQVIDKNQQYHDTFHAFNKQRKEAIAKLFGQSAPPEGAISTDQAIDMGVLTPTDERPVTTKPSDVYVNVPNIERVATTSADGTVTTIEINRGERTYSPCALKYGLSLCIRLDTLWPRAMDGFKRNPLLGSGYATLNKETIYQFTEAESTDNNFLRTLGETGVLGFVTFYGVVALGLGYAFKNLSSKDWLAKALSIGFISATIGLLLNAVYIDVFAASKVAFTYWGFLGLFISYVLLLSPGQNSVAVQPVAPTAIKKSRPKKRASH
jgi:hypothetical protein